MKKITEEIIDKISHDLRKVKGESFYATAKETGLRAEVIKKIEAHPIQGKAESLITYIDNYCSRFPASAFKILYSAATTAGQKKDLFEH